MRKLVFLVISIISLSASAERYRDEESPLFSGRVFSYGPPGLQILAGFSDIVAGGVSLGAGFKAREGMSGTDHSVQHAEAQVRKIREALARDPRLSRMREIRQLLVSLQPTTGLPSCAAQVERLAEELETLALNSGGSKSEDEWYLEIEAAEAEINRALRRHQIQTGKAFILITGGGYFLAQVGTRIWIYNYYERDPGLAPNAVIAYAYGVKPVFRFLGILENVEGLFTSEGRDAEEKEYERFRRSQGGGGLQ